MIEVVTREIEQIEALRRGIGPAVSVFGSARIREDDAVFALTRDIAAALSAAGLTVIDDSMAWYQREFTEQRSVAKDYFVSFMGEYGIDDRNPIYDSARSAADVRYRLMQIGVSTKSLGGSRSSPTASRCRPTR